MQASYTPRLPGLKPKVTLAKDMATKNQLWFISKKIIMTMRKIMSLKPQMTRGKLH
jgi:hypothetical protein